MSELVPHLPAVNASLNGCSFALLLSGYIAIRKGKRTLHPKLMLAATGASVLFLCSYLVYHANAGSRAFPKDEPFWRAIYLWVILLPHTVLAVVNVPLILITLRHAFKGRLDRHRRIARWTLGLWLYVSLTGVLIYLMLYHWFPA